MKLNGKDDKRRLNVSIHNGKDFLIVESERYEVYGRWKWDYQRVYITTEEMSKLIKFALATKEAL